jgi:hypothetical protein
MTWAVRVVVLPLNLAVGVLQLMQQLACLDGTCSSALAAELSSSSSSSSGSGQPGNYLVEADGYCY